MDRCKFKLTPALLTALLVDEQNGAAFYQSLSENADTPENAAILASIRDDEIRHFIILKELFCKYFRCEPKLPPVAEVSYQSFADGIKTAIADELTAYEDYRNIYLSNRDMLVKETVFETMTDEIEHAVWENMILSTLSVKN